ncbi:MAG: AI-2E family transporter [Rhodomicrobium sp.]
MSDLVRQSGTEGEQHPIRPLTDDLMEFLAKLGLLGFLLFWSIVLIRPFLSIVLWSLILTVTLYPAFDWIARLLGDRRKLAAAIVTALALLVFTGPAIWLGLSMIEGLSALSERLKAGAITIPPPSDEIRTWPLIGERLHHFWNLASTNLKSALTEALPYLQPLRSTARKMAENAAAGIPSFLISLIIAGFLFSPAPSFLEAIRKLGQRILPAHGQEFVQLSGATIRNVSQGVVGVALLQAVLSGLGFIVAGIPGSGLLALAVLIFGILQFPSVVLLPVMIWSWTAMPATVALAFTAYLIPVGLINNILSPIVMAHGLKTPMLVILIGVMGGAVAHGLIGLFLGPIVLAVTWELIAAWVKREEAPATPGSTADLHISDASCGKAFLQE